jgi:hypothetical protein
MKLAATRLLLIAAAAGLMTVAASPSFAWYCSTKNARGAVYWETGPLESGTCARALSRCMNDSAYPGSCHIISSHP